MGDLPLLLTHSPLDVAALTGAVSAVNRGAQGALATFVGVVRRENAGRRVTHLEYEAYEPLALKVFGCIREEIAGRWPSVALALAHRLGRLEIGEASVAIVAGSAHRADAFAAARYAIERVKQIAPIWKHEFFEGGDVWIEGAAADPEDEAARQRALDYSACA